MSPEVITAAASLVGVALGLVGGVIAARIQARGAHAQAEATLRAALDTAQLQRATTLDQQIRDARRAVYARFLAAAHHCSSLVNELLDGSATPAITRDAETELGITRALVELEGPDDLTHEAQIAASSATSLFRSLIAKKDLLHALNILEFPDAFGLTETQSDDASTAYGTLLNLASTRNDISPDWRLILVRSFESADRSAILSNTSARWTRRNPRPSEDAIREFDRAARTTWAALIVTVEAQTITRKQARDALRFAGSSRAFLEMGIPANMERDRTALNEAIERFRVKAHRALHGQSAAASPEGHSTFTQRDGV